MRVGLSRARTPIRSRWPADLALMSTKRCWRSGYRGLHGLLATGFAQEMRNDHAEGGSHPKSEPSGASDGELGRHVQVLGAATFISVGGTDAHLRL